MKKTLAIFLAMVLVLVLASCADSQENSLQDAFSSIEGNVNQPSENASSDAVSEITSENSTENNTSAQEIDYSPYSMLLNAYTLDYNISSLSASDYEIIGMTLTPTYPEYPEEDMVDASGFCYANLIDLDGNGVLELVMIAYDEQEWNYQDDSQDGKIQITELQYQDVIKVYTIDPNDGLLLLGSLPLSYLSMPVSSNYGIEYVVSGDKTYISHSEVWQMGNGDIYYYGLTDGIFGIETHFSITIDGSFFINDEEYTWEEFDEISSSYGESILHPIENLNDIYLEELNLINEETFNFLADYPAGNFDTSYAAYNNGQFFCMEYTENSSSPKNAAITQYYRAITVRDYDALSEVITDTRDVELFELWHHSKEHTYVPGYIISDLRPVTPGMIENPDMATDIVDYISELDSKNTAIVYGLVNEVLDPHVANLGLQVAGGIYPTYFILSSDDPDGLSWKLEEIFDNKFYW